MSAVPKQLTPWKPGQSGNPGGRQKRLFPRVDEMLKQHGKEPIAELLKLLPQLHVRDQAKLWLEILPYVHAKVKPMEENEENELEKMTTAELVQLVKDKLPEVG